MADVRSLLRQQRAARRVDHPHAAYSDAGKLLCVVCHESIRAEALWDGHVRSAGHRQRLQALQAAGRSSGALGEAGDVGAAQSHKRKHDDDEDMADLLEEEAVRKKRSKPDMTAAVVTTTAPDDGGDGSVSTSSTGRKELGDKEKEVGKVMPQPHEDPTKLTPPLLRRASSTPGQGVEIKIASRPATPVAGRDGSSAGGTGTSASSTPKGLPPGRSPLIPQEAGTSSTQPLTRSGLGLGLGLGLSAGAAIPSSSTARRGVDEDEWAAFEAEMVHGAPLSTVPAATKAFASEVVISAAPMSAEEVAARSAEEERAKRKALVDIQLEDEKEDATRALETEFEEMEELEARIKKLKERREALRVPSAAAGAALGKLGGVEPDGKENLSGGEVDLASADDDEYDEEDEWDGFRFRG